MIGLGFKFSAGLLPLGKVWGKGSSHDMLAAERLGGFAFIGDSWHTGMKHGGEGIRSAFETYSRPHYNFRTGVGAPLFS